MATLKEEIESINASNASLTAKHAALVSLGLKPYEIELVIKNTRSERFTFTFGVEMECFVSRENVLHECENNHIKVSATYGNYTHVDSKDTYKFVQDSSVDDPQEEWHDAIECVTPVLSGRNGMSSLRDCCKSLNDAGARVRKCCGLHVHIGAARMSDEQYINVFKNYQKLESVIDTFMAPSRRGNLSRWCSTLQDHDFSGCRTKMDVRHLLLSRYHRVNADAYVTHKTIEFRQHAGTTNFEKISNWVNFLAKLVAYSKKNVINEVNTIDEIPFLTQSEKDYFKGRAETLRTCAD